MNKQHITLVSHGHFEHDFLERIMTDVSIEFQLPVSHEELHFDLSVYYNPSRRQYDGNEILKMLNSQYHNQSIKTIGLFRVDLFIPILTFIFGQAIFRGNSGIASLYRLKNEQYGLKKDDELLYERFRKVIIHELGHTYGLVHCHAPSCVMRSATYVEDIDQKKNHFCIDCKTQIMQAIKAT